MMRPSVGGTPATGSPPRRKSSITGASPNAASATPMTFFMASESMLDAGQTPTASMSDTTFGVRSLAEDPPLHTQDEREEGRRRSTIIAPRSLVRDMSKDSLSMGSFASSSSNNSSPSRPQQPKVNTADAIKSRLPLSFQSPVLGTSEPSSPKSTLSSFRPSDDELIDDRSSQAIASDSEDEVGPTTDMTDTHAVAPQFIMPSIMMPSRRPFSKRGNAIGRLKILLAGGSGTGKTSLIKSIVQTCDDIVHIDASRVASTTSKKFKNHPLRYNKTKQVCETWASTKAYASWWSDIEESNIIRRKNSGDGTVLERNICFVDTPGYDSGTSILEGMDSVLRYIESQGSKALDVTNLDDSEIMHLLGGGGGSQVDVVLYLLSHPLKPADLEFMKQLSTMANVVPLLARMDLLPADHITRIQASISEELAAAEIRPFPLSLQRPLCYLYTVCSSPMKDLENMDASLLMQSDYIQPLQESDLGSLIEHLFSPETVRKLKYFAAKKIIKTRNTPRTSNLAVSPGRTGITTGSARSHTLSPSDFFRPSQALTTRGPTAMTYTQATVTDHTLREERLARVHLANWAANLQRSLANERARYESIVKAERAEWLKARLGECVFEQDILSPSVEHRTNLALVPRKGIASPRAVQSPQLRPVPGLHKTAFHDPADPLGLLRWQDNLHRNAWFLTKVISGAGIIGAVSTFLFFTVKTWTENGSSQGTSPWSMIGSWWDSFDF